MTEYDDRPVPCNPIKNKECKKTGCFLIGGHCNTTWRKECVRDFRTENLTPLFDKIEKMKVKEVLEDLEFIYRMADRYSEFNDYINQETAQAYGNVSGWIVNQAIEQVFNDEKKG